MEPRALCMRRMASVNVPSSVPSQEGIFGLAGDVKDRSLQDPRESIENKKCRPSSMGPPLGVCFHRRQFPLFVQMDGHIIRGSKHDHSVAPSGFEQE